MRRLRSHMLVPAILILVAATGADDVATSSRRPARVATATVTIIQAERVTPADEGVTSQKRDRQIRKRENKPLVEFY